MEWLAGILGVIVGAAIQEFRYWRESRERYRLMTFEKRLIAHQEAFSWCNALFEIIIPENPDEERTKLINEAKRWWQNNSLFLDEVSRQELSYLILYATGININRENYMKFYDKYFDAKKAITKGIGAKHLPELSEIERESIKKTSDKG